MKKRRVLSCLLALCMAMSIAGCSSGDKKTDAKGDKTPVKLAVWASGAADNFNKAADEFNSRQDKIKFTVEMQSGDYGQYLGAKTAANDLPDMYFLAPYSQVQQFAKNGKSLDLSDRPFVDKLYETSKAAGEYEGKMYAYPMVQEMLGIFYNKDMFADAGITKIPTTVTEFKEVCEKLKAKGYTPLAATYKDSWTINHAYSCLQGAVLNDNIDTWISDMNAGKASFDIENSDLMFNFMDIMKENSGENYMDADSTSGFNALATGEAAMLFSGEFSLLNLKSINPDLPIGLFAVPVTENPEDAKLDVDVGICVAVNKDGKNIDQTLEVLDYMSDNTDTKGWMANTADDMGSATPCMEYNGSFKADYMDDYHKYLSEQKVRPWVYQQLASGANNIIADTVQGYFAGSKDKTTVLDELDTKYKDLLK